MPALIDDVTCNVRKLLTTLFENDFKGNLQELSSHGVEELVNTLVSGLMDAGRASVERYIQSFEQEAATIKVAGESWHRSDHCEKSFLTKVGEITLSRGLYYRRDKKGRAIKSQQALVPLDRAWGMQGRFATAEVVEGLLSASAFMTPGETAKLYSKIAGITPSASLIYKVIQEDGKRLKEMVDQHSERRWQETKIAEETEFVVASFDGANVCMRKPGTKCARPSEGPGNHGKNKEDDEQETSAYRNVMVGAISSYKAQEISDNTGETDWKPKRLQSHYLAEMPEQGFGTFREKSIAALNELREQFPREGVTKLLLMDGARNLWKWAQSEPCFSDFDWLLDFYHASEHLSEAAENLFGKKSKEARSWYVKWKRKLKREENAVEGLIRSINYRLKQRRLSATRRSAAEKERNFFVNNRDKMNYAIYVEMGCPIGSGPVEAACKTIVKQRMGRSGMRWNHESGGNILNLRVLTNSDHWESTWAHYREQNWELDAA